MYKELNLSEQTYLLNIARQSLESAVRGNPLPEINLDQLPDSLSEIGASFVTLTINNQLRGCIGAIDAYQPLAMDVQEHAIAAGLNDFRFPKVTVRELPLIKIEVSVLTPRSRVNYEQPQDLTFKIKPFVDGVILQDGIHKATFLPQVWEKLPQPEEFLSHLCMKMGASGDIWRKKLLDVFVYQVQDFQE